MKSRKLLNPDGSTKSIVLSKESGAYNTFTPREAAQAIVELSTQLWSGIPLSKEDSRK